MKKTKTATGQTGKVMGGLTRVVEILVGIGLFLAGIFATALIIYLAVKTGQWIWRT